MRAVIQRVSHASVTIDSQKTAAMEEGLLVLCGFSDSDTQKDIDIVAQKILRMRIFCDENDKMNLSLYDNTPKGIIVVSNFTLYASCVHGRRPDFFAAARPEKAIPLYEAFLSSLDCHAREIFKEKGLCSEPYIGSGRFGADMEVELLNDGPVTIILDSSELL